MKGEGGKGAAGDGRGDKEKAKENPIKYHVFLSETK